MTKILIVGAGATGGALGARLISAGKHVTFLVRERRGAQLARSGLHFRAPDTEVTHQVRAVTSVDGEEPFDVVIIAVKAPALAEIIPLLFRAIGPGTRIIPLLNGMAHIDVLEEAFPGQVLGGVVKIVATLDAESTVMQMTPLCVLTVGGLRGEAVPAKIADLLHAEGITVELVDDVVSRLWEKWAFIAAAGVITCLLRGTIGDILTAGGRDMILTAIEECERVASVAGHPVGGTGQAQSRALLTEPGSPFTSSLYRDLLRGDPAEAEHIIGDFSARASALGVSTPLLDLALLQLRTHHAAMSRVKIPDGAVGVRA